MEGISFKRNKWVFFTIAATILGSTSSLFDKFLVANFNRLALQAWFSIYMLIVLLPLLILEKKYLSIKNTTFKWRITIPFIGIFLVMADFAYFLASFQVIPTMACSFLLKSFFCHILGYL